jgi:hypothetical protein
VLARSKMAAGGRERMCGIRERGKGRSTAEETPYLATNPQPNHTARPTTKSVPKHSSVINENGIIYLYD